MKAHLKFTGKTVNVYPHHVNYHGVVVYRLIAEPEIEYLADELEFIDEDTNSTKSEQ